MKCTSTQITEGLMKYADEEIMSKLPSTGQWILGTGISMANKQVGNIVDNFKDNSLMKMLGAVDEDGNWDVDEIASSMAEAARKYGKLKIDIPLIGKLTFSLSDIDVLKGYIERGASDGN